VTPLLAVILAYAILLTAVGFWVGRRVSTAGDFFVAGRRLGPGLLFSTLLAANIGAGSTVNAAALGYRDGLSAWWWIGSAGLGSMVLGLWVGPRIRRVAATHGFHTVGDFLEDRYGSPVRAAAAALLWVGTVALLAAQLIAGAAILTVVAGIFLPLGFVTGLLGINVGGVPLAQDPWGFAWVLGVLVVITAGEVLYFRWRRWV